MPRKIVLFEANEIPYPILDDFIASHPESRLARELPRCRQYTTETADTGSLSPWITWPTLISPRLTPSIPRSGASLPTPVSRQACSVHCIPGPCPPMRTSSTITSPTLLLGLPNVIRTNSPYSKSSTSPWLGNLPAMSRAPSMWAPWRPSCRGHRDWVCECKP